MTIPQTLANIKAVKDQLPGTNVQQFSASHAQAFVTTAQQALTQQLAMDEQNIRETQQLYTIASNTISNLRLRRDSLRADVLSNLRGVFSAITGYNNQHANNNRFTALVAPILPTLAIPTPNPLSMQDIQQDVVAAMAVTDQIPSQKGQASLSQKISQAWMAYVNSDIDNTIATLQTALAIPGGTAPNTGLLHDFYTITSYFNTTTTIPAQTIDVGSATQQLGLDQYFLSLGGTAARTGMPAIAPTYSLPTPFVLDITVNGIVQKITVTGVTINQNNEIDFSNVQVTDPKDFDGFPISGDVSVSATYMLPNNIPVVYSKKLPLTIKQGVLTSTMQETSLATMQAQIDLISSSVWNNGATGYNKVLRQQVDQFLTNNGMSISVIPASYRTRLINHIMVDPSVMNIYTLHGAQGFMSEFITAPVHPVGHPQAGQPTRTYSPLFVKDQRITVKAYEKQIRESLTNGTMPTSARTFLEKRLLELLGNPAIMQTVMTAANNEMNTMMNTMQYLTTGAAQNRLQNDLQYFEHNRGYIHPVGTIAERYRGNPLVRRFRNLRDRCNGESPNRPHLRTVLERENPAAHNYMAYFAGMDAVSNPISHPDVVLPEGAGNVTIQTGIRMHNYQQIIPQIRIGGAINYALDARFTHDGSLQGIIEGIMRPETQIPGANEASTYVIKSHIIMQLYKTYVQEMIQRMGSFQDYGNPRTQMTLENGLLRITQGDQVLFDETEWRETGDGMPVVAAQRHRLMSAYNQNYVDGMTERPRHMAQSRLRRIRYRNRVDEEGRLDFAFKSGEGDETIYGEYQCGQMRLQIPQRDERTQEILRDEEGNIMYNTIPANPGSRRRGMDMDRIFAMPSLYGRQHEIMKAFYWKYISELFKKPRVRDHHRRTTTSAGQQAGGVKAYGVRYNGRTYVITHTGTGRLMMGEVPLEGAQPHLNAQSGLIYPVPNNIMQYNSTTAGQILTNPMIMNHFIEHMVGQM